MAEAERLYRLVLEQQPRNFAALRFLGVIAGHARNWPAGIKLLRAALKVEPRSAEAHTDLGGLPGKAWDKIPTWYSPIEKAVNIAPNLPETSRGGSDVSRRRRSCSIPVV